jgi:hypothetical protein
MMEIGTIILGMLIGMGLACLLIYLYIRGLIRKVMTELDAHIEKAASTLMPVVVERANGVIFCYGKEDNQFICQGATLAEIKEAFNKRFPDKTAYLDGGDPELVKELREEIVRLKLQEAGNENSTSQ